MVSVRRRRANKATHKKATRRTKDKQRNINIASNPIIEANWDYSLTLKQNYKKLGLTSKLQIAAGGTEQSLEKPRIKKIAHDPYQRDEEDEGEESEEESEDDEDIDENDIPLGEARIVRDKETNEVIKVIYGKKKPLTDELMLADTHDIPEEEKTEVVKQLEAYANRPVIRQERTASERESDWLKALWEKYSDDYAKMKWDKKLNIFQQSEGDLKRRITKWRKQNGL
ncbi:hypothetical protein WICPIJ_006730 [Wickerhamomyces pijperi]|uniref:Nucleolar protein 16 n=1 Tax=Wickerhamomyces pijperi TaxID=599730 RepID=A0A9P8Q3H1_WICPI|nr:hypothetical protein WICPIJ_006730 [Wickerhamomyces pijperi]